MRLLANLHLHFVFCQSKAMLPMTRVKKDIKEKRCKMKKVGMIDGFIFHKSEKCVDIGS